MRGEKQASIFNRRNSCPPRASSLYFVPAAENGNFKTRWALIKAGFSRSLPPIERRSKSRIARGERGIWQRRYWEHLIRDEDDFERHAAYIHWNPVKHGWVTRVKDWPYSSFHAYVKRGLYPENWSSEPEGIIQGGE